MDTINLNQMAPNRGVANTNYFNGRILAAEDLTADQAARRLQVAQLGGAVGAGVAYGLQVHASTASGGATTSPATSVTVAAGVAVNRRGRPLSLPADIEVAIAVTTQPAPVGAGLFADCQPLQSSAAVVNTGFYILTIAPASDYEGAVAAVDLSGADPTISGCGSANVVEGVKFRLVKVNLDTLPGVSANTLKRVNGLMGQTDAASLSLLRNLLAHVCFGTEQWLKAGSNFADVLLAQPPDDPFGALTALRSGKLITDCDVPLALIYWTQSGIGFVDRWAVRRGLEPIRRDIGFPLVAGSGHSLSRAVLAQFQEHVEDLARLLPTTPALASMGLWNLVAYAPAVAVVPVSDINSPSGFDWTALFHGHAAQEQRTFISLNELIGLFAKADGSPPTVIGSMTVLQLYWLPDNLFAAAGTQRYVVFATPNLHGFQEKDALVNTLHDTWSVYASLLKRAVIMPRTLTDATLPVWTTLMVTQQSIIQFAMTRESAAGAGALDNLAAIQAFGVADPSSRPEGLYGLQEDLLAAMKAAIKVVDLSAYYNPLATLLDQKLPDGSPGLGPSVLASDIQGAIKAQQAINHQVGLWGDAVAVGYIQVQPGAYLSTNLNPGNPTPYTFDFQVTNRTDQQSVVAILTAAVLTADQFQPPPGNWPHALPIIDQNAPTAPATDTLQLTLAQDVQHPITVQLLVPPGVALGLNLVVRVTATVPPPSSISSTGDKTGLLTSNAPPNPSTVGFTVALGNVQGNPSNAMPGVPFFFTFNSQYVPGQSQAPPTLPTCTFTAKLTGTNTAISSWSPEIRGDSAAFDGVDTLKTTFPLPAAGTAGVQSTTIAFKPPARSGQDQKLTFTVQLQATYIDSQGKTQTLSDNANGQTFSVTVKHL